MTKVVTKQMTRDRKEAKRFGIKSLRSYAKFVKVKTMPKKRFTTGQRKWQYNHMRRRRGLQKAFYGPQWRYKRYTKRSKM